MTDTEKEEVLFLKPNKILRALNAISLICCYLWFLILLIGSIKLQLWTCVFIFGFLFLIIIPKTIFSLAEIYNQIKGIYPNNGALTLENKGLIFHIQSRKILYRWEHIKKFNLTYSRFSSSVNFLFINNKTISISDFLPLSNENIFNLLTNWHNHILKGEPVKDFNLYPTQDRKSEILIYLLLKIPLILWINFMFTQWIFFPTSSFIFKNGSNSAITNLSVKSGVSIKSTFKPIAKLAPGETQQAVLQGFNKEILEITYTQDNKPICKRFAKKKCSWDNDLFIFKENEQVEATTNPPKNSNCAVHIYQWYCY